jgi:hypothetical protein
MTESPLWRQAFDAAEKRVTPHAEKLVRTPAFALATALARRSQATARGTVRGLTARAWHLVNLPAGSDVSRLRAQVGALDREIRRLTVQLETERRRTERADNRTSTRTSSPTNGPAGGRRATEERDADGAQPADDPRARPAGRRTQRPAGS